MIIAVPISNGRLSMHFGHCDAFALFDVNAETQSIRNRKDVDAPDHQPGLLPPWLAEQGANMILAGGMGQRAQMLFQQQGIDVVLGASSETPEQLVKALLAGTLETGANICDH